jgi:uncharacterized protein with GYD domain
MGFDGPAPTTKGCIQKRGTMLRYVTFFSYTGEAWERMIKRPGNRANAARELIEEIGGKMEAFYWMLGGWDGLIIYQVPDVASAAALAGRVISSDLLRGISTHQLLSSDEGHEALLKAKAAAGAYQPPGTQREWHADYELEL